MLRLIALGLLLMGCAGPERVISLNVTHCDPASRDDCWTVSHETLMSLIADAQTHDALYEALHICHERL